MYEYSNQRSVAEATSYERATFIKKTYNHLGFAILAFIIIEAILLNLPFTKDIVKMMLGGQYSFLIILAAFMFISYIAESWARSNTSRNMQYLGLMLYVVAEAIIFLPLLYIAAYYASDPNLIAKAGIVTLGLFTAITFVAFFTKTDFSFLRGILIFASFVAMGTIISSIIFGFALGSLFAALMVLFAGGCILYDTSNIIHHYKTDQYVAASLSLFASVALMFWYILRLFMSRD